MEKSTNTLNWFEIPVTDIDRATKFYEAVFGAAMERSDMMGLKMAMFPSDMGNGKVSGALVQGDGYTPSMDGTKIYLNGNPDLSTALNNVEAAGGKILMPKTKITDDIGHMAFFTDTEGNAMALHSQN